MSASTLLVPVAPPTDHRRRRLVAVFAVTQTVGYGALIQSFTVLLVPMATELGTTRTAVTVPRVPGSGTR